MKFNIRSLAACSMISFLIFFAGCGSGGGGSGTGGSGGTGSLALSLTDAPSDDFEAVYVTIERVEVHLGGNENSPKNWQVINPPESGVTGFVKKTYNLLDLTNGVLEELGLTELPAGNYTQMRLFIGEEHDGALNKFGDPHVYANYVVEVKSGTTEQIPMKVPSGTQTGIKLVKGFTVGKNQRTHLILDFDAAKSVHRAGTSGKYILQPSIKVLDAVVLGYYIKGTVFDEYGMGLEGASVSAQRGYSPIRDPDPGPRYEVVVENTTSSDEDGNFRLLVYPGTYNVVAYKDTYGFAYRCGVDAAADAVSGVTTVLTLADLESGVTGYGYVGGNVTVAAGGDVTISFRTPYCVNNIEVKSETISGVTEQASWYEVMLPELPDETAYQVVAWSDETTEVVSGVTVQSEKTTVLDFEF